LSSQIEPVDLDTALLRAFVAAVEEKHFGRAAGRLLISQQALSKRIQRLEALLGAQLLDRGTRRVEITLAGQRLLPHARKIVAAVDAAATATRPVNAPLRIDVLYEPLAPLRIVRRIAERDPELHMEVTARNDARPVIPALRRGDVDITFGRAMADPWPADIARHLALLEPIGLLVGAGHRLAARSEVRLIQLRDVPLWFPAASAPPDWTTLLGELCDQFQITVSSSGTAMGFDHFLDRTATDPDTATFYGLGMHPPTDPRLRLIPITGPTPVFAWYAMWHRQLPDDIVARFVAHLDADTALMGPGIPPALDPQYVWLPASDRARLTRPRHLAGIVMMAD
jgi:DNA-binding transcriptional LysR family regulator